MQRAYLYSVLHIPRTIIDAYNGFLEPNRAINMLVKQEIVAAVRSHFVVKLYTRHGVSPEAIPALSLTF